MTKLFWVTTCSGSKAMIKFKSSSHPDFLFGLDTGKIIFSIEDLNKDLEKHFISRAHPSLFLYAINTKTGKIFPLNINLANMAWGELAPGDTRAEEGYIEVR